MKQYDVIALGELLIDFTDYGKSEQGNPVFEANPGGAPCNVLALLKKYNPEVYEELLIRGMMIGYGKLTREEQTAELDRFVPMINSWGVRK